MEKTVNRTYVMISQRTDRKRRTEDGGRRTEDGGRRAESGERRTKNGEWRTENGEREREKGKRRAERAEEKIENGEQETGIASEKRRKRNGTREAGNGEKITGVWDGKSIVNLPNNSKWRMTSRKEGMNSRSEQALSTNSVVAWTPSLHHVECFSLLL